MALSALWIAGCGGSGGGEAPPPPAAPAVPKVVTRIEIAPAGLVLRPGETAQITARVVDQNGQTMTGQAVTWRSSGASVSVAADGRVTAGTAIDSAQITARVANVPSAPITAMVAQPASGARLLPDSEILTDPVPIDATQTGLPGSRLSVRLGAAAPAIGQILLASGGKAVAGRVISTVPAAGGGHDVVFETVGLAEVFEMAKIVIRQDGADLPVSFPSGDPVSATLAPNGTPQRRFTLNIPATPALAGASRTKGVAAAAQGKQAKAARDFRVGPLRCNSSGSVEPSFGGTTVDATTTGSLGIVESTFIVDQGLAYVRVLAEGSFGVTLRGSVRLSGQLSGQVSCGATLVRVPVPVPPQVALIVQPVVPLGFRFKVNGELNSPALELKLDSSVTQPIRAGFELQPDGTLENLSSLDSTQLSTSFAWDFTADPAAAGFKLDAEASAGLFADAALTNPFLTLAAPSLGIDPDLRLLESFAGFNAALRLQSPAAQMLAPSQPSGYDVRFRATVGTSATINRALTLIGAAVGATSIGTPEVRWEPSLIRPPTGAGIASLRKFQAGDRVTYSTLLAPDSVKSSFLGQELVAYNVKRVEIWRKEADGSATRVASRDATAGATEFSTEWTADRDGDLGATYFAFVVPKIGESFPLLLGAVSGWNGVFQLGASTRDEARGFGFDDKGRVYVATTTPSNIGFRDPGTGEVVELPQFGGWDAQVLRMNALGTTTGGLAFGSAGDDVPYQMRRGPDGSLYAIGRSAGVPGNAFFSAWIAKVDVSGVAPRLVWRREIGARNEVAFGMDFGNDGSVYTVSSRSGAAANIGGTAFAVSCGDPMLGNGGVDDPDDCGDLVVTRMTADGDVVWRSVASRPGWQFDPSIAVRGDTVHVVSNTLCEIEDASVGTNPRCKRNDWRDPQSGNAPVPLPMIGISRISTAGGAFTFVKSLKTVESGAPVPTDMSVYTLAIDDAGNLIIGGQIRRAGPGYLQGTSPSPYYFAGLSPDGAKTWSRVYGEGGGSAPAARGLVRAADGDFYAVFCSNRAVFAPSAGGYDIVVVKLGADGTERWGVQLGSPGDERAHGVDLDTYGNVFVFGNTTGGFGRGLSEGFGERDIFVLKLSAKGQIQKIDTTRPKAQLAALPRLAIP